MLDSQVRKVVIPAAGLGTRLLPATKEQPKEMLPVFALDAQGKACVKPLLQLVFEQLFDAGYRNFCFVVGRGKRAIEDHFTADLGFVNELEKKGKAQAARDLEAFYKKLDQSAVVWVNQPEPRGFGDAVLKSSAYVGEENFLVHAGDTYIASKKNDHLNRIVRTFTQNKADCAFLTQQIQDPRQYGVVKYTKKTKGVLKIEQVVEKPEKPLSKMAVLPVYVFSSRIFDTLRDIMPGVGGELQLTDGIERLITQGKDVYGLPLQQDEARLDIGNPASYFQGLEFSYHGERFLKRKKKRNQSNM